MLMRNIGILVIAFQFFQVLLQYQKGGLGSFATMGTWHTISFWAPLALGIVLIAAGIRQMRG